MTLTVSAQDVDLVIDPEFGGRCVSWRVGGIELLVTEAASAVAYGMYPMAPWAGRLADDAVCFADSRWPMPVSHEGRALHGIVLDRPMKVIESTPDRVVLERALGDPWPWAGTVRVVWQVHPMGVDLHLEVSSDEQPFPAVAGWHPWFRRRLGVGDALIWTFPEEESWRLAERGSGHELTGRFVSVDASDGPFDDAFHVGSGRARIDWPHALTIDVQSSHDWFVVYDERPDAVCIEPQSGPPNGINEPALAPVTVVAPQAPLHLHTAWTITHGRS